MKKQLLLFIFSLPFFIVAQSWNNMTSPVTNDFEDIHFCDNSNGLAVGRQGKIIRTADGGTTWAEMNSGTTKDINKVFMLSATSAFAVGDGGVVLKLNGNSWSVVNINFSQDMFGVHFLDASTGWISGDWGRIMKTTDGGATWNIQMSNSIYSNCFFGLYMLSASEGWAVGSSGRVLKYDGTNWSSVANPATTNMTDLYAVSFSSSSNGFMSGKSSSVFYYNGSAWSAHSTALPDNSYHVYDIETVNSTLAYAATSPGFGGGGIILKYNGNTWVKDYEYTGMNSELFTGICTTSNGNILACATGGLMKIKTGGTPTGIAKQEAGHWIAFPNPANDCLHIKPATNYAALVQYELQDMTGATVLKGENVVMNDSDEILLETSALSPGLYFWKVYAGDHSSQGKVVKK